jgi:hypothetical protein
MLFATLEKQIYVLLVQENYLPNLQSPMIIIPAKHIDYTHKYHEKLDLQTPFRT